jgi:hypothetical protein
LRDRLSAVQLVTCRMCSGTANQATGFMCNAHPVLAPVAADRDDAVGHHCAVNKLDTAQANARPTVAVKKPVRAKW